MIFRQQLAWKTYSRSFGVVTIITLGPSACATQSAPAYLQEADDEYLTFYENVAKTLLPGYRLPREEDFASYWSRFPSYVYGTHDDQNDRKAPFWTKGLFNDDEVVDFAFIVLDEDDRSKNLFAIVSTATGYRTILLDDTFDEELGLQTRQSGDVTATADGERTPGTVHVLRHAIELIHFESHGALFVWDAESEGFVRYY